VIGPIDLWVDTGMGWQLGWGVGLRLLVGTMICGFHGVFVSDMPLVQLAWSQVDCRLGPLILACLRFVVHAACLLAPFCKLQRKMALCNFACRLYILVTGENYLLFFDKSRRFLLKPNINLQKYILSFINHQVLIKVSKSKS
jgi:hypothetical protein